jgi:hypothetical protein
MKRIVMLVAMLAMLALMAAPALAQGQVERGPAHANSICSFSGQNDTPDAPFPEGGRVQSFGQLVRQGVIAPGAEPGRAVPGFACNGHLSPLQEGNPEG